MLVDFIVRVDRTGADFQADFNQLRPQGYRPMSLSVYQAGNPLYAVVWVKRANAPDWSAVAGVDGAGYRTAFNNAVAAGFHPVLLSATGAGNSITFAGVFEQGGGVPLTRFNLTSGDVNDPNTIQHWHQQGQANGWIMTSGAVYGDSHTPLYAGIWPGNGNQLTWNAEGIVDDFNQYQARFNAQTSGFARPVFVTLSDYGRYLSIFTDSSWGPNIAFHGITRADLDAALARYGALGYFPMCLQAGGSGGGIRYAVIFVQQDQPLAREWNVTGPDAPAAIDAAAKTLLQTTGMRGMSIAVVNGTRLVCTRGYTWAEPGYPAVLPTTQFRMASCSKTVTALAIEQLIEAGSLHLTDQLQNVLQLIPPPGHAIDAGFAAVKVQELLEHRSGLGGGASDGQVTAMLGTILPVTPWDVARVGATFPLADPNKKMAYSNFGYWLLGLIVAKRRSMNFIDAVQQNMGNPLQVTRMRRSSPLIATSYPDEARYHRLSLWSSDPNGEHRFGLWLGNSVMTTDQPMVPGVYGDRNLWNEDASGGLSASAVDFMRLIAGLNFTGAGAIVSRSSLSAMLQRAIDNIALHNNPQDSRAGYGFDSMGVNGAGRFNGFKGGYLFTSQNYFWFELDGTSVLVNYNGTHPLSAADPIQQIAAATDWSKQPDLFPQFGMPSM